MENPRNIYPTKIKAHTDLGSFVVETPVATSELRRLSASLGNTIIDLDIELMGNISARHVLPAPLV